MIEQRICDAIGVICQDLAERRPSRRPSAKETYNELVLCILGSQVTHEMSLAAFARLRRLRLVTPSTRLARQRERYRRRVEDALLAPLRTGRYRFPRVAADRLARLAAAFPAGPRDLLKLMRTHADARDLRRALTRLRCGVGPKQASLFLRNVGTSSDLAVLDTHSLRFMRIVGLAPSAAPPRDLRDYEKREERLQAYALGFAQPMGRFDAALWIVMRAARSARVA
jgi:N-glycosylase/DNA lyase